MSYQRLDNFQTSLSVSEIESMRQKILDSLSELRLKKNLIHVHDYNSILSHLQFVLNLYNSWLANKKFESLNPYVKCQFNPYQNNHDVVYQPDGTTVTIIDEKAVKSEASWKSQFDQQVLNVPVYSLPPANVWNINKIKSINL